MISDAFIQELRGRADIEETVSQYVNLRRRGNLMTGLCPFHNEKTPSFTVYTQSQSFYCFGCGAGGDIISFVRRIENIDYVEAVKLLAQRAGMHMPEDGYDDTLMKRRQEILAANREAARFFHEQLFTPRGRTALGYLQGRALDAKTIQHFGLGYAPDAWGELLNALRSKGFSEQVLLEANLARKSEKGNAYDNFRNRLMFPIIDIRGNVVAFGGRVLDDSKPKYINTSDTMVYKKSHAVFALNFAKNENGGKLIVAEGYMDVIALHQAGFTNAVACLGTALTKEQANLLSRYGEEVLLAYDTDGAGQQATKRAIEIFRSTSLRVRVLQMSGGKDPDEIIKNHGRDRFRDIIENAANDIEYRLLRERENHDVTTDSGKMQFLKAAAELLAALPGEIERDIYLTRLAQELEVSKEAIAREVAFRREKRLKNREKEKERSLEKGLEFGLRQRNALQNPQQRGVRAEEILLSSLLRNPDFYKKVQGKIQSVDFLTELYGRLFAVLAQRADAQMELDPLFLSQSFSPDEMSAVMRLTRMEDLLKNSVQECEDCIAVILEEKKKNMPSDVGKLDDSEYLRLFQKKL